MKLFLKKVLEICICCLIELNKQDLWDWIIIEDGVQKRKYSRVYDLRSEKSGKLLNSSDLVTVNICYLKWLIRNYKDNLEHTQMSHQHMIMPRKSHDINASVPNRAYHSPVLMPCVWLIYVSWKHSCVTGQVNFKAWVYWENR